MIGASKARGVSFVSCVIAFCLAVTMAFGGTSLIVPAQALAAPNQAVLNQRSGVFKFNWGIDGVEYARGSAFLINADTVVTAYHCVMPSSYELGHLGYNMQDVQERSTYTVTIAGDFQVPATLEKVSEKQDIAILKLEQRLSNTSPLTLRDSSTVDASEQVFSLGFPATADQNAVVTFTSNDVAVVDGTVSKPEAQMTYLTNTRQECEGSFLMTTCRIEGGSSGGPMVDDDGNVIGVCVASDSSFYYAAASDVLMQALDTMSYKYNKASADPSGKGSSGSSTSSSTSTSTSTGTGTGTGTGNSSTSGKTTHTLQMSALNSAIGKAEGEDPNKYTADSYKALQDALEKAKAVQSTEELTDPTDESEYEAAQSHIDDAAQALINAENGLVERETGLPMPVIIGIIVAVVAVIVIIVLVIVMRSRKKKRDEQTPTVPLGAPSAPSPSIPGVTGGSQTWQKPGPGGNASGQGDVAETTILNDTASDTIILFQAASGGSLTRMSTNEQIPINSAEFTIGRERSKVNYCLEGNSSISRVHARIVVRDGSVYLIDNRAANGTFVNGVKARPGQEILLKNGDIITLADEKFKYNA